MRILFVCTGNTCRSPMAEAYFNSLPEAAKPDMSANSAGLFVNRGSVTSEYARLALAEAGIILPEKAREAVAVSEADVAASDVVYGMTAAHAERLKERYPRCSNRIFPLPRDVGDPFGGTPGEYRRCLSEIKQAVDQAVKTLSPPFIVRPLGAERLGEAVKIEAESFSEPWSEAMFGETLESPLNRSFCVLVRGELAGYICSYDFGEEIEILNLAVKREYRRKGAAKLLLKTVSESSEAQIIRLEVRCGNLPARSLYNSLGFCETGLRKNYYTSPIEDAVLMEKDERKPNAEKVASL